MDDCDVFISFATPDESWARRVKRRIESLSGGRLRVFMCHESVDPGEKWREAIDAALESCSTLVVLATQTALERPWVAYEVGRASTKPNPARILTLVRGRRGPPAPIAAHQVVGRVSSWWDLVSRDRRRLLQQITDIAMRSAGAAKSARYPWHERWRSSVGWFVATLGVAAGLLGRCGGAPATSVASIEITDATEERYSGITNKPISLKALARLVRELGEVKPAVLAFDIDLSEGGRTEVEIRELALALDCLPDGVRVVVPRGSAYLLVVEAEGRQASPRLIEGAMLFAGTPRAVPVEDADGYPALALMAAAKSPPWGASAGVLPFITPRHLAAVVVVRPEDGIPRALSNAVVLIGGHIRRGRSEAEQDLWTVRRPPLGDLVTVPGVRVHALAAGHALAGGLLWDPVEWPLYLMVAAAFAIGLLEWRSAPLIAAIVLLAGSIVARLALGLVPMPGPIIAAVLADKSLRRFLW